jgi:hypothetical protein
MARPLTSGELDLLRIDGQWTKLYLAVLQPNTIYTARLASLPSSNDNVHTISVTTESGTLSDVKPGMTAYVGSAAGAHDLGMVRIRKAPITGTWYIGLTSEIVWQSTCHLTIVDDFDLWAKHAVIDSGALKMDVDVAYSDQHASFNPVPVLGSHAVLWLEGATVDVEFDASDSWVPGSTISGYSWSAPGASATSGLATATPTLTYNAAGYYRVLCTITAANGKTTTGVRYVFVFDEDNMPATVFQLAQCVGDYETGGWMFDLTMEDEASLSEIRDRSLVVLFAEDWYGTLDDLTKQSIGPIEGRENIVCVGRIVGQSIRWDRESGHVHFTVQGLHHWLNKTNGFPVQIQPATVASSWSQMPLMTVDRVLWHILYWHSTAIETMDFYPTGDTRYAPEGLSMAATIWGQLADVAFSKIFASPGVDRYGRLFVEVDPQMVPEGSRSSIPVVMDLTDDDWQEGIDLQRVTVEDVSIIRLTSINTNSSGGSSTLYSLSPGHTPRRYGNPELIDRVLAASQGQSNQLAGLVLGWRTNEFPDVPVILLQNNRMFDLFPRQYAGLTMAEGDTPREAEFDGNLIPRRITLFFDNEISYMHSEINFEAATSEQLSTNGDIPDVDAGDLEFPPLPPLPELPEIDFIVPGTSEPTPEGPPRVLLHSITMGLLYSENFNEASPEWITINAGLTPTQYQNINVVFVCPNGALYVGFIMSADSSNYLSRQTFVARAPFIGGTFEVLISEPDFRPVGLAGNWGVFGLGYNPLVAEQVAYIAGVVSVDKKIYVGAGSSFAAGATVDGANLLWGTLSFGLGNWLYTRYTHFSRIAADGSSVVATGSPTIEGNTTEEGHVRASATGITFHAKDFSTNIYKAADNFASSTELGNGTDEIRIGFPESFAVDPSGTLIMARVGAGARGKSSDGGATFASMGALPVGNWWWSYAGGAGVESRWVAAGGTAIRYSDDFGTTWVNKEGNLSYVDPVSQINMVKVISY